MSRPSPQRPLIGVLIIAALALVGIVLFSGLWTPVRFVAEHIEVTVANGGIEVDGMYEYHNTAPWPTALRLEIPFPVDDQHLEPDSLALDVLDENGTPISSILPVVHGDEVSLRVFFRPKQIYRLRLRYAQQVIATNARYILLSTREWRHPIKKAIFDLRLCPGLQLKSSNYQLTRLPTVRGSAHYGFQRSDFWPDRDWVFTWINTKEQP